MATEISNELIKLKIKKYISHYEYVLNTYEETMYLFEKYKQEFYKDCPRNSMKNKNNNEDNNNIKNPPLDNDNIDDNKDDNKDDNIDNTNNIDDSNNNVVALKSLNKIYHKLCLKTHPDKDSSNSYGHQFTIISDAYNKKDFLKLLLMCRELHIDIDYVTFENNDYDILFEKSINILNEKIESIKSTLAWNWVCANDEQKELLRQKFL